MKCCEGEEGDDGDRKQVLHIFRKKVLESLSRLSGQSIVQGLPVAVTCSTAVGM